MDWVDDRREPEDFPKITENENPEITENSGVAEDLPYPDEDDGSMTCALVDARDARSLDNSGIGEDCGEDEDPDEISVGLSAIPAVEDDAAFGSYNAGVSLALPKERGSADDADSGDELDEGGTAVGSVAEPEFGVMGGMGNELREIRGDSPGGSDGRKDLAVSNPERSAPRAADYGTPLGEEISDPPEPKVDGLEPAQSDKTDDQQDVTRRGADTGILPDAGICEPVDEPGVQSVNWGPPGKDTQVAAPSVAERDQQDVLALPPEQLLARQPEMVEKGLEIPPGYEWDRSDFPRWRRPKDAAGETLEESFPKLRNTYESEFRWWLSLRDKPKRMREEASLNKLGKRYEKVRITVEVQQGWQSAADVRVEVFDAQTGWEDLNLQPQQGVRLSDIGIGVATEEAERAIDKYLPNETWLDKLTDLVKVAVAPETLVPKLCGLAVEGVGRHAGMPGFAARWAGEAVEQIVTPLCKPDGVQSELLAGLDGVAITCDIDNGQVTSEVVNLALDDLADKLKDRLGENDRCGPQRQ